MTDYDPTIPLQILFRDEHYVAVYKPHNLLVHKTQISNDKVFLLQLLRNQIGQYVYPIHRLDRPTAGVILFGLTSEAVEKIKPQFQNHTLKKTYWAIVRGFCATEGVIDSDLQEDEHKPLQSAITHFKTRHHLEIEFPVGRYTTARYSWVEVNPLTGRMHQIRKHFARIAHPIVGDTTHGDRFHNRFWQTTLGYQRLWLLAHSLEFTHPYTQKRIHISVDLDEDWQKITHHFLTDRLRFLNTEMMRTSMAKEP